MLRLFPLFAFSLSLSPPLYSSILPRSSSPLLPLLSPAQFTRRTYSSFPRSVGTSGTTKKRDSLRRKRTTG